MAAERPAGQLAALVAECMRERAVHHPHVLGAGAVPLRVAVPPREFACAGYEDADAVIESVATG
jgi:hypothetical protein